MPEPLPWDLTDGVPKIVTTLPDGDELERKIRDEHAASVLLRECSYEVWDIRRRTPGMAYPTDPVTALNQAVEHGNDNDLEKMVGIWSATLRMEGVPKHRTHFDRLLGCPDVHEDAKKLVATALWRAREPELYARQRDVERRVEHSLPSDFKDDADRFDATAAGDLLATAKNAGLQHPGDEPEDKMAALKTWAASSPEARGRLAEAWADALKNGDKRVANAIGWFESKRSGADLDLRNASVIAHAQAGGLQPREPHSGMGL